MGFITAAILACIGTVLAAIALTHPHEVRTERWRVIAFSLPLVLAITRLFYGELAVIGGFFGIMAVAALAFVWKSVLAHYAAGGVGRLLFGSMNVRTGIRPDFRTAKSAYRERDYAAAIQLTRQELEKEPGSYEGLLLLSTIHEDNAEPVRAIGALELLLATGELTNEQRLLVATRRSNLRERETVKRLNETKFA